MANGSTHPMAVHSNLTVRPMGNICPHARKLREDVDAAVDAAWAAWESWKKTTPAKRADALLKIADVIDQNKEKLALLETLDNGKPIRETMAIDIPYAADHFRYFAGAVRTEEGEAAMLDENTLSLILREPIGVVGQIVPWNFPFLMAAWKLAPVLAAGCCTVFKPSSYTSLSVLELAKLIDGILPPGVFNIVTGRGSKSGAVYAGASRLPEAGIYRFFRWAARWAVRLRRN